VPMPKRPWVPLSPALAHELAVYGWLAAQEAWLDHHAPPDIYAVWTLPTPTTLRWHWYHAPSSPEFIRPSDRLCPASQGASFTHHIPFATLEARLTYRTLTWRWIPHTVLVGYRGDPWLTWTVPWDGTIPVIPQWPPALARLWRTALRQPGPLRLSPWARWWAHWPNPDQATGRFVAGLLALVVGGLSLLSAVWLWGTFH